MGFPYEPLTATKRDFIETQVKSMQVTYYRNLLDITKAKKLRDDTPAKFKDTYQQKINEYTLQNEEIKTTIDLMGKEYATLGED